MRRTLLLATLAPMILLPVGCGGDDADGGTTTTAAPSDDLSSYPSVTELAADLDGAGLTCTLEYEGLKDDDREVSICAVNNEYTELSVWTDPAQAAVVADAAAAADDPFVEGANWTIDVDTDATAKAVADALGGRAVGVA